MKYLRYVPNADHSLKGSDAYETLLACYSAVLGTDPLPQFSWTLEKDGAIRVTAKDTAYRSQAVAGHESRCPRFPAGNTGPQVSEPVTLTDQGGGVYVGKVPAPAKGWTAFFVELTFPSGSRAPFKFTTQVRVVPDVLPFKFVPNGKPKS